MDKNHKLCQICGNEAKNLCLQCTYYFCEEWSKYVHDKKLNNNHKKEKIDYFVPYETRCSIHPKERINLFCLDEKGK